MSEKKANLAIVGSGLAGLALGFELLQTSSQPLDFYRLPQPKSASQVSAGLLHLFHGKSAHLAPMARIGLSLTLDLVEQMSKLKGPDLLSKLSFLRPSRGFIQQEQFIARAKQHPQEMNFGSYELDGKLYEQALLIHDGWLVDTPRYLENLEKYLMDRGCRFIDEKADSEILKGYEKVVLAAGPSTLTLMEELSNQPPPETLSTILTKGQLAICPNTAAPPTVINARAYIAPSPVLHTTLVGATFERKFETESPFPCSERTEIWQEALALWPGLANASPEWVSGLRLSGPDHLPFLARCRSNLFVIGGMGSKGLLYHRLMAQRLTRLMMRSNSMKDWEIFSLKTLDGDYLF